MSKNITTSILLFFASHLCAYEVQNPSLTVVQTIQNGTKPGNLYYGRPDPNDPFTPTSLAIVETGYVIVKDVRQGLVLLDRDNTMLDAWPSATVNRSFVFGSHFIGLGESTIYSAQITGGKFALRQSISVTDENNNSVKLSYVFFDDSFLVGISDSDYVIFKLTKDGLGKAKVSDFLNNGGKKTASGRLVSAKLGLLSDSLGLFRLEFGLPYRQPPPVNGHDDTVDYNNAILFGIDLVGNRYYVLPSERILKVDAIAQILSVYRIDDKDSEDTIVSWPFLDSSGSIYFLNSKRNKHELVRVKM